jgi:hypothetical protein
VSITYSPDGRWYWDGERWQPVATAGWQPVATPGPPWRGPYASADARATAAVTLVGLAAGASVLFFFGGALGLLALIIAPGSPLALTAGFLQLVAELGFVSGAIGAAISVPMWMHRAYRNLPALGATDLRWSPAWAASAWFLPAGNLFIPYLIGRELWTRAGGQPVPASPMLPPWWAACLVAFVLLVLSNLLGLGDVVIGSLLGLLDDIAIVAAGALMILIIRSVTRRQEDRAAALRSEA